MTKEEFEKLYFKAKLGGAASIGELIMRLIGSDDEKFVLELIREFSPGLIEQLENASSYISSYISEERPCKKSPYGLCYTAPLGKSTEQAYIEQMYTDPIYCTWCDTIYRI